MASCNPPTFPSSTFLQLFLAPSKIQPKRFFKNEKIFLYETKTTNISIGWWFQPIWKICSSNWIISPGVKMKHLWSCHHLENTWEKKSSHRLTPYHPCNCVYLLTWMVDFYGFSCRYNYIPSIPWYDWYGYLYPPALKHLHRHKDFQLPNPCHALLSGCRKHDGFLRLEAVVVTNSWHRFERHESPGKKGGTKSGGWDQWLGFLWVM